MSCQDFVLEREYIELHVLLKLMSLAPSGGTAKAMIADGLVTVDGEVETRKARKLRSGATVQLGDAIVRIVAVDSSG